ncbi:lipoyl(octanoyl) transferase LipB [bacterium]|nr:lipoyl(octanoyl) transferase LipB [bacterium]
MADHLPLDVLRLGRLGWPQCYSRQLELHTARRMDEIPDTLVLVEHDPVITLGRSGDTANLIVDREHLAELGVGWQEIERGGDITYHGPGQLVGYPVVNLRARGMSVRELMHGLEEAIIRTLHEWGIDSERIPGLTGVWVGEVKLAALGVAVRGGVSYHGLALNVTTDLSFYDLIIPCGINGKQVGSIESVSGQSPTLDEVGNALEREFREVFGYRSPEGDYQADLWE